MATRLELDPFAAESHSTHALLPYNSFDLPGIHHFSAVGRAPAQGARAFDQARQLMVQKEVVGRGISNPRVIRAMGLVPRHQFVPSQERLSAYLDAAIPLGFGQTITSPYVVAFMTAQLEPVPTDRVLEIGTGSGYQAAVFSRIVAEVYSIEIVEPLGKRAARTLRQLRYNNVYTKIGDGYQGWPEHAPFDKIIVTCSPKHVPPAFVAQLKEGGRLIVPLGERFQQTLFLFRKIDGILQQEELESTFFVPMTGTAEELRKQKEDDATPHIVNGGFEQSAENGEPKGWFYVRNAQVERSPTAPEASHVLVLASSTAGQKCHAIQAFGIDGRRHRALEISAEVRTREVVIAGSPQSLPHIEVLFYDENRKFISRQNVGT